MANTSDVANDAEKIKMLIDLLDKNYDIHFTSVDPQAIQSDHLSDNKIDSDDTNIDSENESPIKQRLNSDIDAMSFPNISKYTVDAIKDHLNAIIDLIDEDFQTTLSNDPIAASSMQADMRYPLRSGDIDEIINEVEAIDWEEACDIAIRNHDIISFLAAQSIANAIEGYIDPRLQIACELIDIYTATKAVLMYPQGLTNEDLAEMKPAKAEFLNTIRSSIQYAYDEETAADIAKNSLLLYVQSTYDDIYDDTNQENVNDSQQESEYNYDDFEPLNDFTTTQPIDTDSEEDNRFN